MTKTFETSKELRNISDWMLRRGEMEDFEPDMDDFIRWAAILDSLIIPELGDRDDN